jgi:hypothetical protein
MVPSPSDYSCLGNGDSKLYRNVDEYSPILFYFYTYTVHLLWFLQRPTNAQLTDKLLYCSYMFRHYCVVFRELVVLINLNIEIQKEKKKYV